MPDSRFFKTGEGLDLGALAALSGATLTGGLDRVITAAAPLAAAGEGTVSYIADKKWLPELAATKAGAVFAPPALVKDVPAGCVVLETRHPQAAWAMAAAALHPVQQPQESGVFVHADAELEDGVTVMPGAFIAQGARIGRGTILYCGAVIGPGVAIGRSCEIGPGASVRFALVGDRVSILAGARIGEAGFAVASGPKGPVDVPQLGRVILQDGVTVGANSCVDRGGYDDTVIGENTKLDNLVHVGHNVCIGRGCRLAAYTGISGSVTIGDGVLFGGKAGVADWVEIGDGAAVGASASVFKDIPAREVWTGFPARPMRRWLREQATLSKLARPGRGAKDEQD